MPKRMDGPGLAALTVGIVFVYGGIKGFSPIKAFQNILKGKNPNEGQTAIALTAATVTSGGGTSGGVAPSDASQTAFIKAMLTSMGAPSTTANINSLASWMRHEFGSWPPSAKNNPFATTEKMPSSTTFNSVGVQNYANAADGVAANVKTLTNGRYNSIVNALIAGTGVCGNGFASEFSTWSGGGYTSVC